MLLALLSDVHANREALDACVADARASGAEKFVFLGDVVGYGADPAYCTDRVAEWVGRGAIAVLGNHDQAVETGGPTMNSLGRAAIAWTRAQLTSVQRNFLAQLPLRRSESDRCYVHADASAPERWIYVTSKREARQSLAATDARVMFCGHVHCPRLYSEAPSVIDEHRVGIDAMHLAPGVRWLAVLGAVGQPRDGDPRACYGLFQTEDAALILRRVPYDVRAAAAKILSAQLPPALAERLFAGR